MAQIQQIQIKFVAAEDRLMLRVSGSDNSEFRFWLTRRFVKLMWPSVVDSLEATPSMQASVSPIAKKEVLAFEHEKAVTDSDFKTPYNEKPKALPLGTEPILLVKMQIRRNGDGTMVMALAPEQGPGIDLALNAKLLHSLTALIANSVRVAEWGLPLTIGEQNGQSKPGNVTLN